MARESAVRSTTPATRALGDDRRPSDTTRLSDAEANRLLAEFEYATGCHVLDSVPHQLHVATAERCNMRCIMCRVSADPDEFESHLADRVHADLDALLPLTDTVYITGAEPFHQFATGPVRRMIDSVAHLTGPSFVTTTNGLLMTEKVCDVVLDRFSRIRISVDSPHPDVYESIRVRSSFERVQRNIEYLRDLKARHGRGRRDKPTIHINYLIMDRTYRGVVEFIELANEWGVSEVRFSPLRVNFDQALHDEKIFDDIYKVIELADLMTEARREASDYGMDVIDRTAQLVREALAAHQVIPVASPRSKDSPRKQHMPVCPAPWSHLWIARNGEARFCLQGATIGDVSGSPIHEVYNSDTAQRIRRGFLAGDYSSCKRRQCPRGIRNVGTNLGVVPDDFEAQRVEILQRDAYIRVRRRTM